MTDVSAMERIMQRALGNHPQEPSDNRLIGEAFRARIRGEVETLDQGFKLTPTWPTALRGAGKAEALLELMKDSGTATPNGAAVVIHGRLRKYFPRFNSVDLSNGFASRACEATLFQILVDNKGKLPAERTLRRWIEQLWPKFQKNWPTEA